MNNVMLDIRALGEYYDSPLLAIECVFFEPSTGRIGPQYYRAVDLSRAENIDPAAVIELLKEDSHQRAEIVNASCSEFDAIALFFDFIRQNTDQHCDPSFWSKRPALVSQWLIHTS
ncbi:3'-5' exoribonuclease domain-containing protein, partial [Klebsiella pneumoniae]